MNIKRVTFGNEAIDKILKGINTLSDAVSSTLGAEGKTVIIEDSNGNPIITKDGVTVAKSINLEDPISNIGAILIRQASEKTVDSVGDGTTTSTLLAKSIVNNAVGRIREGNSPVKIKREIDLCLGEVVDLLKKSSTPVKKTDLENIATISVNNDYELGKIIADAFKIAGENGMVLVENSENEKTYIDSNEGISLGRGFESNIFINEESKQRCVFDNPLLLISDIKIERIEDIIPFVELSIKDKRPLLIYSDVDEKILSALAMNKVKNGFKICVVKPALFGDRKKNMLKDIAISTGGNVISDDTGDNISIADESFLGSADKVTVTSDDTIIITSKKFKEDVCNRIKSLKEQYKETKNAVEKRFLKERISNISGGISIIKVGALSDIELKEKSDRVDDAVHAVKASIEEGYVSGGGVELLDISNKLIKRKGKDINVGEKILLESIRLPFIKILDNAGVEFKKYLTDKKKYGYGINVKTLNSVYMKDDGIIDPVKVTRKALENAVSVSGTILLTDTVVSIARAK
tara:strand:+ start:475 stop:2040 length:1566 start_codon:yes stop_codon:yes gene_type:complete